MSKSKVELMEDVYNELAPDWRGIPTKGKNMKTVDEVIELNRRLTAIATQVIDDVEDMAKTSDHALFYERMVANAQDFETALQIAEGKA